MNRQLPIYCFLVALTVASNGFAVDTERLLLPIASVQMSGADGSLWTSEVFCRNDSDVSVFVSPLAVSDTAVPPHLTIRLPLFLIGPGKVPGQWLHVERDAIGNLHISVRVRDIHREAAGVDVPAVRLNQFRTSPIEFLNIPTDQHLRLMLRIYAIDPSEHDRALVRVFDLSDDRLLDAADLDLRYDGLPIYSPGYAQMPIHGDRENRPVRIEVTPSTVGLYLWAFVTATKETTSEVTPFFPH